MKIQGLLVDDTPLSGQNLRSLLHQHCPQIKVTALADSADMARRLIRNHAPEVIFIKAELAKGSAFSLLEQFPQRKFSVVFIADTSDHLLRAIETNIVDYLLYPIDIEALVATTEKLNCIHRNHSLADKHRKHIYTPSATENLGNQPIDDLTGLQFLDTKQIMHLIAHQTRTFIHQEKGIKVVPTSLKDLEDTMDKNQFVRIQRTCIINLAYLKECIHQGEEAIVLMHDGSQFVVSKRKLTYLYDKMDLFMNSRTRR